MRLNKIRVLTLGLVVLGTVPLCAQSLPAAPVDPKIRYGKLENGLTYYIRANKEPKQRADFYIAQNVGAILEEDNQNGLAHFLEHMAFNGTKNYPGKGIINYLEKIGVKFGADINAHTGLDETVYTLCDVPTTRKGIIDSALLVLHDWSNYISLEDAEIDAERGVIREEWRTGASAERRMMKEANKLKYAGSKYAKRDVIGDTAVINNFSHNTLREFYQKWYHPDLQAILVVGDIDVDQVENTIKTMFSSIPKNPNPGLRPVFPIPGNTDPIVTVVKDKEARVTRFQLEYKHEKLPAEVKLSVNGYVVSLVNSLISMMINERFDEISQKADAPFVSPYSYYGELVKSKDVFIMGAVSKPGQEEKGLSALLLEAQKIKRFGFTAAELDRAKTDMLKSMEKLYNERDNHKNNNLIEEYSRNFLYNEPIPGIEWEYNTVKAVFPGLNIDNVNQLAKSYVTDSNMIVSFSGPDNEKVVMPSNATILSLVNAAKTADVKAPVNQVFNKPLVKIVPKAGAVKTVSKNAKLGTEEWTLSNGIRVIFKPTTFKKDEILLSAYASGGLSKVNSVDDLPSAQLATSIVSNNGLGDYSLVDLGKVLTGKIASVKPQIGSYEQGFSGNSSVADFESMMQLTYLYFTSVRKDNDAYQSLVNSYRVGLANSAKEPRKAFSDSIGMIYNNYSKRKVIMSLATLDKVNQDKAISIFKERFAVPANFTFIFTGNINSSDPAVKKAILTYLGGLKSAKMADKYVDRGIRRPKGKVNCSFEKEMQMKKASNFVAYSASIPYNLQNDLIMSAIGDILDLRYTESIREKEGGTYGVGVWGAVDDIPVNEANIIVQFDTDPLKQAKLIGLVYSEIDNIVKNGPKAEDVQKVKENMLKKYEESLAENGWWTAAVKSYNQKKIDLVNDYKKAVEKLDQASIQAVLKSIVEQGNVIEVVMKPAK